MRWPSLRINISSLKTPAGAVSVARHGTPRSELAIDETVQSSGVEITTASVRDGTDIRITGVVVPTTSGVEFIGRVRSNWIGDCRRCVESVSGEIDEPVRTEFLDDSDVADDETDAYPIAHDHIDLGEVVFEELMLALPLSPLCSEACAGADPDRFPTRVIAESIGADDESDPGIDPRWAALSELTFDEDRP